MVVTERNIQEALQAYLETGLFMSRDPSGIPLDREHDTSQVCKEVRHRSEAEIRMVCERASDFTGDIDPAQFGRDLWFYRNGDESIFLNKDNYEAKDAKKIMAAARALEPVCLYLRKDGMVGLIADRNNQMAA